MAEVLAVTTMPDSRKALATRADRGPQRAHGGSCRPTPGGRDNRPGGVAVADAPAAAHGEGETEEGCLLVQQALGHVAHDTSMGGIDAAMEKVQDALDTKDQEGVDVSELEQGMSALQAGDVDQARRPLQDSIATAPEALASRFGQPDCDAHRRAGAPRSVRMAHPGLDLPARAVRRPADRSWLAYLFRPQDKLRNLRSMLGGSGTAASPAASQGTRGS